ncbi:MAG: ATP-binding protein [Candidatus Krumholzibacteriia bacterium]
MPTSPAFALGTVPGLVIASLVAALALVLTGYLRQRARARRMQERHALVLASISDHITFVDRDLTVVWTNWTPESGGPPLVGGHCYRVLVDGEEPCPGCPVPTVLATGEPAEGVVTLEDGLVYRVSAAPVCDDRGHLVGVVQTSRDITEKRRLAERLQQAEKMEAVGQLAAGVAHDFNNSLQVILGYTELLASGTVAGTDGAAQLGAIRRAAEQARDVVGQLLTFSRRQESRRQSLDLAALIDDQAAALARVLGDAVSVRWQRPARPVPPVTADPAQVQEVLLNLCLNARDAMPGGGVITLELACEETRPEEAVPAPAPAAGRYVVVSVSDTGEGIPAGLRDRIFEPFLTTKPVDRGTGLGLSAVYGIVTAHEGFITVDSEAGSGSTFRVGWPAAAADAAATAAVGGRRSRAAGRVLLVEDDADVRELAAAALVHDGFTVDTAANGRDALARLVESGCRYDAVVMDVALPGLNGWTVYRQAREVCPELRVIFCSGHGPSQLESEFRMSIPDQEFLQKPYAPQELTGRVRALIGSAPADDGAAG